MINFVQLTKYKGILHRLMLTFNYEKNYKHINQQTGNTSSLETRTRIAEPVNREFLKRGETARDADWIDRQTETRID